jgi:hypothetical protein
MMSSHSGIISHMGIKVVDLAMGIKVVDLAMGLLKKEPMQ